MEKKEQQFVREITNMEDDFAQWYTDIITKADLVDYSPVKGFMVIKHYDSKYNHFVGIHRIFV